MTWMLTATGAEVNLRWLDAERISMLDIAHHLAQINRYTGACRRPLSVAEHSLLVVEILEREMHETRPEVLLGGLLHDAHEAYTQDLAQPMKQVVGTAWEVEETRIAWAVRERFGVGKACVNYNGVIKAADLTALSTERAAMLPPGQTVWPVSKSHPAVTWHNFDACSSWSWIEWRDAFLDKFGELHYAMMNQPGAAA